MSAPTLSSTASHQEPFAKEGDALARVPGVKAASHVRSEYVLVGGDEMPHRHRPRHDHAVLTDSSGPRIRAGARPARRRRRRVTEYDADGEKLHLSSRISITTPTRDKQKVVTGIYEPPGAKKLLGDVGISQHGFDGLIDQPRNSAARAADSTGGFNLMVCALKALLEHDVVLTSSSIRIRTVVSSEAPQRPPLRGPALHAWCRPSRAGS